MNPIQWRKATTSGGNGGSCVMVAAVGPDNCSQCHNLPPEKQGQPLILVSDSKDDTDTHLHYTINEWDAFISGVKSGEFDTAVLQAGDAAADAA